jgi:hypothetical protein
MSDLFLYAPTEADMNAALLAAGVIDENGNPPFYIAVDQIGPFQRITGYDDAGEPIFTNYPDWHTNLCGSLTEEQLTALDPLRVYPLVPYRVFG